MSIKKTFIVVCILLFANYAHAQQANTELVKKHELGIDVANILTFLKRNNQSYLINYWYTPKSKYSYRFGLNFDIGNGESDGVYPSVKAGIQKNKRTGFYNLYYGADLSYSYFKSNAQTNDVTRFGISPTIGVEYCFNKNFSMCTEASLNGYFYKETDPATFSPQKEKTYHRILIGSVGMVMIKYRFD